eukprot:COSAG06_NODE_30493_length_538_cov_0.692483_1_plen_50_part_10
MAVLSRSRPLSTMSRESQTKTHESVRAERWMMVTVALRKAVRTRWRVVRS